MGIAHQKLVLGYRSVWGPSSTWSTRACRPWRHPWRKPGAMSTSNQHRIWTKPGGVRDRTARGDGLRSRPGGWSWWCGGRVVARSPQNSWGEYYWGELVTDRWSAYTWYPSWRRQLCWAHLLRDIAAMIECGGRSRELGEALRAQTQ
jgi:hypothetical protein